MVDIRDQIEDNRGTIKKIQLLIPGYAGYRRGEDLRDADNILRNQVANILQQGISKLNDVRTQLLDHPDKSMIQSIGNVIFSVEDIAGKIRHMSLGYSGISWDIKVTPEVEEKLYEYDMQLGLNVKAVIDSIAPLLASAQTNDKNKFLACISDIKGKLSSIEITFNNRLNDVKNIKAL